MTDAEYLAEFLAHLLKFVELGDHAYAKYAAKRYAVTEPWRLAGLPDALDVAIGLRSLKG